MSYTLYNSYDVPISKKVQQQNIKIVTSKLMIEGMSLIHAYTVTSENLMRGFPLRHCVENAANAAANKAAEDGNNNITVLTTIVALASGDAQYNNVYEVSYWK